MRRRDFLKGLGAAAVVVGFDPMARSWVTEAAASECRSFEDVPALGGQLLLEPEPREAVATDQGNIVRVVPCAVLLPGSVADITRMIRYCRIHNIRVSCQGQGHTTHGQSLSPGLLIDNRTLAKIHALGPAGADVEAGALWKDLICVAYDKGFTAPAITGYTQLSIGGTLSVGGIGGLSSTLKRGAQIDAVRELEVVTGRGDVVTCSLDRGRDLFEAMLGGLGQCGVITRARMDLVPAKQRARTYIFNYIDNTSHFRDLRALLNRSGLDHVFTQWLPPGVADFLGVPQPSGTGSFVYHLQATVFYDLTRPPNDLALAGGLSTPPQAIQDLTYLEYIFSVDNVIDAFRATVAWDDLVKPWFDVWLPDSTIEQYVGEVIPTLTAHDTGPTGFILLFPQKRSRLTRPFFRVPEADGNGWVYLFDILGASQSAGPDPDYATEMVARNDRLFTEARGLGGTRYPIGSLSFTSADWQQHYGEAWADFASRKRRFDPDGILTPGPGIFG